MACESQRRSKRTRPWFGGGREASASTAPGLDPLQPLKRSVLALVECFLGNGTPRKPIPLLLASPRRRRR
ncbi:hypothetical protein NDU88_001767 [Pleurodeles waltl]|uniref:Uncharacterized protein n=1 Tax=Pleurodeles waltl TaxID=8319 RepID=A0AAV7LAH4_PLEWA|nr:hypothetical protein NDU88_001767 [Pleurodeles waltl]